MSLSSVLPSLLMSPWVAHDFSPFSLVYSETILASANGLFSKVWPDYNVTLCSDVLNTIAFLVPQCPECGPTANGAPCGAGVADVTIA